MNCTKCGQNISDDLLICPECGTDVGVELKKRQYHEKVVKGKARISNSFRSVPYLIMLVAASMIALINLIFTIEAFTTLSWIKGIISICFCSLSASVAISGWIMVFSQKQIKSETVKHLDGICEIMEGVGGILIAVFILIAILLLLIVIVGSAIISKLGGALDGASDFLGSFGGEEASDLIDGIGGVLSGGITAMFFFFVIIIAAGIALSVNLVNVYKSLKGYLSMLAESIPLMLYEDEKIRFGYDLYYKAPKIRLFFFSIITVLLGATIFLSSALAGLHIILYGVYTIAFMLWIMSHQNTCHSVSAELEHAEKLLNTAQEETSKRRRAVLREQEEAERKRKEEERKQEEALRKAEEDRKRQEEERQREEEARKRSEEEKKRIEEERREREKKENEKDFQQQQFMMMQQMMMQYM